MRFLFSLLIVALLGVSASGCFYIGDQKIRVLPSTGSTATRAMQDGDGEVRVMESAAPEGDTFFLFLRLTQ